MAGNPLVPDQLEKAAAELASTARQIRELAAAVEELLGNFDRTREKVEDFVEELTDVLRRVKGK